MEVKKGDTIKAWLEQYVSATLRDYSNGHIMRGSSHRLSLAGFHFGIFTICVSSTLQH